MTNQPANQPTNQPTTLAAIVLTLNEERHIQECLASLAWADHLVVFDCFSTDGTVGLAQQAGAEVIWHPFENYAQQRNAALEQVQSGSSSWTPTSGPHQSWRRRCGR